MLRLPDEVGGAEAGVGGVVGNQDGLRGAVDAVDVHLALHQLLGVGHEDVTGAADLVYLGDRLSAIGHGPDGRHAADLVYGVDPGDLRRRQHRRVQRLASPARCAQDDLPDTGDPGRNGGHQHRRGIGGGTAGGVQAHPVQGPDQLSQAFLPVHPIPGQDGPVELYYPLGGQLQGLAQIGRHLGSRLRHLGGADLQLVQLQAVEQLGVTPDRGVSLGAHLMEDADHRLLRGNPVPEGLTGPGQHGFGQGVQVQGVNSDQDLLRHFNALNKSELHWFCTSACMLPAWMGLDIPPASRRK